MSLLSPMKSFDISVIIPTLNAESRLQRLVDALRTQTLPALELWVIDSSSDDKTLEIAKEADLRWETIPRELFNHGKARNTAAKLAKGNVLIFLSQDALPADERFIEEITRPIRERTAVAVTARQIPSPGASPLEVYSRRINYPAYSFIRTQEDIASMGVMAYFFSNAASAIDRAYFDQMGGFSEDVIVNEDMLFCAMILRTGQKVAYHAEATVYHTHGYSLREQFQRHFDIGVFFSQAEEQLGGVDPQDRGVKFALGQIRYLLQTGAWSWIVRSLLESLLKYLGYSIGKRSNLLPTWLNRMCSRQTSFWDNLLER